MQAERQAAATSKEEALMELKTRALQLEEELFQVRLQPWELRASSHHSPHLACRRPGPHGRRSLPHLLWSYPLILGQSLTLCSLMGPVGGSTVLRVRLTLPRPGGLLGALSPHSSNGQSLALL